MKLLISNFYMRFFLIIIFMLGAESALAKFAEISPPYIPNDTLSLSEENYWIHESQVFKVSSDEKFIVYSTLNGDIHDIYSIDISSRPKIKKIISSGSTDRFLITPDGSHVIAYKQIDTTAESYRPYGSILSIPINGGEIQVLESSYLPPRDPSLLLQISTDSNYIVYTSYSDINASSQESILLSSVNLTTGENRLLNLGGLIESKFLISPDSKRVVFRSKAPGASQQELYSIPINGGDITKLNANFVEGGSVWRPVTSRPTQFLAPRNAIDTDPAFVSTIGGYDISPDSKHVVYLADQETSGIAELYIVPIEGGEIRKINPPITQELTRASRVFKFSPDGEYIVFRTNQFTAQGFEMFSIPTAGGPIIRLNSDFFNRPEEDRNAWTFIDWNFSISPDSKTVVYRRSDRLLNNSEGSLRKYNLYSVPIVGGVISKLNSNQSFEHDGVVRHYITPDSSQVVFSADQDTPTQNELYITPISGGETTKLNVPLQDDGNVSNISIQISKDGRSVFYRADTSTDRQHEIYSTNLENYAKNKINDNFSAIDNDTFRFYSSTDQKFFIYEKLKPSNIGIRERSLFMSCVNDNDKRCTPLEEDAMCFPIKAKNNKVAVICL